MRSAYIASLVLLSIVLGISVQHASAQLGTDKAFTLEGSGYALSDSSISATSVSIQFTIIQKGTSVQFTLQDGSVDVNGNELTISSFGGSLLKNGQYFRITAKASDSAGNELSFRTLGRLIEKTQTDSVYTITGTLGDPATKPTKLFYTAKISEFTAAKSASAGKKDVTVRILKGSANPGEQTYKDRTDAFFLKYFSEDRISVAAGGTVTFVNEDVVSHSLKSGTISTSRHKDFEADGKISSGDILPGKSWSVTFKEPGFYRLIDEKYQWMDTTIFVTSASGSQTLGSGNPQN